MRFLATFLLGLCLLGMQEVRSQNILWERRLSWPGIDALYDVVSLDSNNYMAIGLSERMGVVLRNQIYYGIPLVKFDENGDTLFVKHFGGFFTSNGALICKGERGVLYIYANIAFSTSGNFIFKVDYNGNILARYPVPIPFDVAIFKIKLARDSTLAMVGIQYGSVSDSMRVINMTRNGIVLWSKNYSGGGTITLGEYLEETPNGTYLASGTTSSNIWAVELDSNGNQLRQGLLYRNTRNVLFTDLAVKAAPDNRFIAAGNFRGSNASYYLGSHNALSNIKNWGGEKIGEMIPPFVNNDGSIVFYYGTPTNLYLSKIDADSTPIWEVSIYNRLAPGCFPRAISYLSDSSAVLVGYTNDNNSSFGKDFYIARIAGVGVPYDPTTPVAIRPQLGSKSGISIWPQPASHANGGTLHFGGFAGPATLALYNMKGQQVLPVLGTAGTATTLLPRQPVPIGHLPPGLYVYRIVAKDRVWTGKVVIGE